VFKLYGRPERYIWNRSDPKSFFFAYPEGPNRDGLFLDTEEALLADFRTASLPAVRANFVKIALRKLSEPVVEPTYRDEKASTSSIPPPRPDGEYRLPPLSFGEGSPHTSAESQPRSLTPITERTDDASRQNSTRTNISEMYERRPSENSKQGSGSSRIPSGEERLAPITDEEQLTDEPAMTKSTMVTSPEDTAPHSAAIVRGMGTQETLDSQTGETVWSQSSASAGDQSGASTPTTNHTHGISRLPPIVTSAGKPMELERPGQLPDLPSAQAQPVDTRGSAVSPPPFTGALATSLAPPVDAGSDQTHRDRSITPQAQPQTGATNQQTLGQGRPSDDQMHAPTPRKVSPGEHVSTTDNALEHEPAAIYLQNMVDEPQSSVPTQQHQQQQLAPAPMSTRVRSPSDSGSLNGIGRKPSGARAPPPKKTSAGPLRSLSAVDEHGQPLPLSPPVSAVGGPTLDTTPKQSDQNLPRSATHDDLGEDVSAYVAYAEQPSPEVDRKGKSRELPPPVKAEEGPRSSFALSKAAQERRAKAEALAAEQERAKRVPGGGKRTGPVVKKDEWMESDSDEDEDEEDQSPEVPLRTLKDDQDGLDRSGSRARALPTIPGRMIDQDQQRPHSRSPNPQPQARDSYIDRDRDMMSMAPPRSQYEQRPGQGRTPPSNQQQQQELQQRQQQQQRLQQQQQAATQNRQSVWNANFAADHGMTENKTGKFVEMEDPATQLTKPFAPHGLLQAGLQDREDRSAKRQEELARETGTSLINVPSKPPPPQTGLLGAVAAHERERKNAGGIGATLTDRERERRQNVSQVRSTERVS
jgi:CCR4-NOT transcriptional complex subunit CAF120